MPRFKEMPMDPSQLMLYGRSVETARRSWFPFSVLNPFQRLSDSVPFPDFRLSTLDF